MLAFRLLQCIDNLILMEQVDIMPVKIPKTKKKNGKTPGNSFAKRMLNHNTRTLYSRIKIMRR